jgi:biotin carboxyl carrier protein
MVSTTSELTNSNLTRLLSADLADAWLSWQCKMLSGTVRGKLYQVSKSVSLGSVLAIWPDSGEGEQLLDEAASEALATNSGIVRTREQYGPGNKRISDLIACPLQVDGQVFAVVSVMLSTRAESQHQAVLQLLQWGGLWMDTLVQQRDTSDISLQIIVAMLKQDNLNASVLELCNILADRYACERVAIGLRRGLSINLLALSHVTHFDQRTQLVRGIESAMEESVDQAQLIRYPDTEQNAQLGRYNAHQELAEQRNVAVCTLPLSGQSNLIGAITLERKANQTLDDRSLQESQLLAHVIGPMLELRLRDERSMWSIFCERLKENAASVFGLSRLKLKLVLLSIVLFVIALSIIDGTYRVTAKASVEGAVRQLLVAPQDAYIKQASVRAGDVVKQGQIIALLDDSDLLLVQQKWQGERNKIQKQYQEALAKRDRSQLGILKAQTEQVEAEISLIKDKIKRTKLTAPFDGVVVSGDLSQSLGAPVETGQVLFEVTPLNSYRVILEVNEYDIAGLEAGKVGQLIIAALPQNSFPVSVMQIIPVAVVNSKSNIFRVEASLNEPNSLLRPGMQGIAKINIGERKVLWIWTHRLLDRLRLWAWSLGL